MTNEEILCAHWSTIAMSHSFTINVFMIKDWNFYEKRFSKISSWNFIIVQGQLIHQGYPGREQGRKNGPGIVLMFHLSGSKWIHRFSLVNKSEFRNLVTVSGSVRALDRSNKHNYSHFKEKATHFLHYSYISTINSRNL